MRFLVLVLTSSALYNLWPQHASHLQTDVNLLDAVHHTRAPHLKCLWGKCVLWGRAEIMWGWVALVANVLLFNIEHALLSLCLPISCSLHYSQHYAITCIPQYTFSLLNCDFTIPACQPITILCVHWTHRGTFHFPKVDCIAVLRLTVDPAHLSTDYCLLPWWISYWTGRIGQWAICEPAHMITGRFNKLAVQHSKSEA